MWEFFQNQRKSCIPIVKARAEMEEAQNLYDLDLQQHKEAVDYYIKNGSKRISRYIYKYKKEKVDANADTDSDTDSEANAEDDV